MTNDNEFFYNNKKIRIIMKDGSQLSVLKDIGDALQLYEDDANTLYIMVELEVENENN
jgi:prophage antirepressor-like protein